MYPEMFETQHYLLATQAAERSLASDQHELETERIRQTLAPAQEALDKLFWRFLANMQVPTLPRYTFDTVVREVDGRQKQVTTNHRVEMTVRSLRGTRVVRVEIVGYEQHVNPFDQQVHFWNSSVSLKATVGELSLEFAVDFSVDELMILLSELLAKSLSGKSYLR